MGEQTSFNPEAVDESCYNQQEEKLQIDTTNTVSKIAMKAMEAVTQYTDTATFEKKAVSLSSTDHPQVWSEDDLVKIFDQMEATTGGMMETWKVYHGHKKALAEDKVRYHRENETKFRGIYMEMGTKAFSTEIDDMRCGRDASINKDLASNFSKGKKRLRNEKDGGGEREELPSILDQDNIVIPDDDERDAEIGGLIDVEVLIRSLESRMYIWTDEERQLLINEPLGSIPSTDKTVPSLTPHERRRRLLFGNVQMQSE